MLYVLTNDREDSEFYKSCIASIKCPHAKEDLSKLSKKEYMKTMICIVTRELDCIKKDNEHEE